MPQEAPVHSIANSFSPIKDGSYRSYIVLKSVGVLSLKNLCSQSRPDLDGIVLVREKN